MEFAFKHRKAIASVTLTTLFIVLLLAFTFTVFASPCYEGSFEDNIMLTADNIGHCISSTETCLINTRGQSGSGGILPLHINFLDIPAKDGFVLLAALFSLLLAAVFRFVNSEHTPVSLRTRIDQ